MAWAFQKESELLPVFNYYLHQMQERGIMDKLRREIVRKHKNAGETQVPDVIVLGYEDLAFPFLALLTGICVAFIQLGIETVKNALALSKMMTRL